MTPPSYRERLRTEGLVLLGSGLAGSALLLLLTKQSRRWPLSTIGQLVLVAALLAALGPRSARKALGTARQVEPGSEGSGEPTPLWHIPAIVLALALSFKLAENLPGGGRAGWDASLRITGGSVLVGAAQAFLLERVVAGEEDASGRRFYRLAGSRLGRGTKLGFSSGRLSTPGR